VRASAVPTEATMLLKERFMENSLRLEWVMRYAAPGLVPPKR
jgi:hypothetical protein